MGWPTRLTQGTDNQTPQVSTAAPEGNAGYQGSQASVATSVQEVGAQTAPSTTSDYNVAPQAASPVASGNGIGYQASQANTVSSVQEAQTQTTQPGVCLRI